MMSAAVLHNLELVWPSLDPKDVIVTGTFDQWSSSIRLVKGDAGFSGTVKIPWGQKIAYKFIVDGRWQCRDDCPQEDDGHGNINNILRAPEMPPGLPPPHDPPARLTIPLKSEGYGDFEAMVTAVEYLTPAEPAAIRGPLPPPIPQITVEGLGQAPSIGTPASEFKLNTAAATEGHVSPTSEAKLDPSKQAPSSCLTLPIDNGPVSLQSVDGNGEANDSHGISDHAPVHLTEEELPPSLSMLGTANETASASAAPQLPPQATPDSFAVTHPPAPGPDAVLEPSPKQAQIVPVETCHPPQTTSPASVSLASSPSAPSSSTWAQKKRRSLLARIKHIFNRDSDKHEKEKNRH